MKIRAGYLILLLFMFFSARSYGQVIKPDSLRQPHSYWAALNAGGSTAGYEGAVTLNAELSKNYLLTGSAQAETNRIDLELFGPGDGRFDNVYNYNLQFGKIFKQQMSFFAISAGLGASHLDAYTNVPVVPAGPQLPFGTNHVTVSNRDNRYGLNLPLLLQGYVVIAPPVALGLNAFVNFNTIRTTAGISLTIALGRITTRNGTTLTSKYPSRTQPRLPGTIL